MYELVHFVTWIVSLFLQPFNNRGAIESGGIAHPAKLLEDLDEISTSQ